MSFDCISEKLLCTKSPSFRFLFLSGAKTNGSAKNGHSEKNGGGGNKRSAFDDDSEEEDYAPPLKSKPAAKATAQEQPKKKKAPTAAAAKPAKKSKYIDSESESDGFQVRLTIR